VYQNVQNIAETEKPQMTI